MINLSIDSYKKLELNAYGKDEAIIDELSTAAVRLLQALEASEGNSVQDNLDRLIVHLIFKSSKERKGLTYGV